MAVTLAELARRFNGRVKGNPDLIIKRVASLEQAGSGDIAFFNDKKLLLKLSKTSAAAIIATKEDAPLFNGTVLIVDDPLLCFARVARLLHPVSIFSPGIHSTAVIESDTLIARTAWVGPHCVVGHGSRIGEDVYLGPGCIIGNEVTIGARTRLEGGLYIGDRCLLGSDCVVSSGAVIGSDGFGFARDGERWLRVPQLGRVVIGDDVEIGSNTTVDRGTLDDTIIGTGVKLDNLIQIAHNVHIGDHTAIAACVGIAGSTQIGKRCTLGGQAGIVGHLEIADDVHITAGSLVTASIREAGMYSSSLKAEPAEKWRRNAAALHHLDELTRRVRKIEQQLASRTKENEN